MNPLDDTDFTELDQARSELREGLASSRQVVRQSRELIGLSECEGASAAEDDVGVAN